MRSRKSWRVGFGLTLLIWLWPLSLRAAVVWVDRSHTEWTQALQLRLAAGEHIMFTRFRQEGEARWVRIQASAGDRLIVTLATPTHADRRFKPQLAVFMPEAQTIGPVLPFEQPPQTLGQVYPASARVRNFEGLTQIDFDLRLSQTIEINSAGQIYLAVYNASSFPGAARLTINRGTEAWYSAIPAFPARWWYSQAWAGWSLSSLFLPAGLLGLVIGGWWWRHPHRTTPPRRAKK